jgi:hypothetical protein
MVFTYFYNTQILGISVKCPILTVGSTRVSVYWTHLPRVKWTKCGASYLHVVLQSLLSRHFAELKEEFSYTSAASICLHGLDTDNFAFNITTHRDLGTVIA